MNKQSDELFENNFGQWCELNGIKLGKNLTQEGFTESTVDLNTLKAAIVRLNTQLLQQIREKMPKEMVNTKDESNSDYFYGYGYNQALSNVHAILDELEGK